MKQSMILSESDAFHRLYGGKTLLLKVSGKELMKKSFPALIKDVRELARFGIKFIIICGSGEQNTQHLKSYLARSGEEWVEAERVRGRRKTDWKQLQHGVLPAYREIREMFQALLPEATILNPEQIHCRRLHELDFVGDPESIDGLDSDAIVVALSVGSDGENLLNINADDTARVATKQKRDLLDEAFFVTESGGVINKGKVAPLLWEEDIADDGTHSRIDVTGGGGGMQKKLQEAKQMLQCVKKIVITDMESVRKEIEQVLGSGTMIVSQKSVRCELLHTADETMIFETLYETHVQSGDSRPRTAGELQALKKHVYLLKVSNSVLGAFALIPKGEWMELATVCSDYNGTGIGDVIVQAAQKQAVIGKKEKIYAFASSTGSATLFMRHHFENLGRISTLQKENPRVYDCLPCISNYDTRKRDPFFCAWHQEIGDARRF